MYFGIVGMVWGVAGGIGPIVGGAFTANVSCESCSLSLSLAMPG